MKRLIWFSIVFAFLAAVVAFASPGAFALLVKILAGILSLICGWWMIVAAIVTVGFLALLAANRDRNG